MSKQIFRKASLERLASPEQLDTLMRVTNPMGWIALTGIAGILFAGILWGVLGSIPTKVMGQGMLIKTGGVFNVVSTSTGRVTEVKVQPGDSVHEGQLVARIAQPDLVQQITTSRLELAGLKAKRDLTVSSSSKQSSMQRSVNVQQRKNIQVSIQMAKENLKNLEEREKTQHELLKDGLITKQELVSTREQMNQTQQQINDLYGQMKQISMQELTSTGDVKQQIVSLNQQIAQAQRELHVLEGQLEETSKVFSPYAGRVIEIKADEAQLISAGMPVLSVEMTGSDIKNLEAVLYVPAAVGKRVKPGMDVQISPTTVQAQEYGVVLGKVTSVSEFPATTEGMMRVLQNDQLVQQMLAGGAVIEIYADLISNPKTVSGYKWSSPKGPPLKIQSGTLCGVSITVFNEKPISLVIPILKTKLGLST